MDKASAHIRLLQAIDYLKDNGKARNHEEIAELTGLSRPNITAAINGNPNRITERNLQKFAAAYSDYINEQWLLTGEGEMQVPDRSLKPHFSAKAAAGFINGVSDAEYSGDSHPYVSGMPDYDFSIETDGDSMMPRIESGDTLLCRRLTDRMNPPIGEICVIDTKEGAVVKQIHSVSDETLTLHSLNPSYHDYEIDLSSILGVAEVVGLTRSLD